MRNLSEKFWTEVLQFCLTRTTYCVKIYADTNKSLGGTETMTASMRLR